MAKKKKKVELTRRQAANILFWLAGGFEEHKNFLRHDDWDSEFDWQSRRRCLRQDQVWQNAIKLLASKIEELGDE